MKTATCVWVLSRWSGMGESDKVAGLVAGMQAYARSDYRITLTLAEWLQPPKPDS
jgi:hypothetical protein